MTSHFKLFYWRLLILFDSQLRLCDRIIASHEQCLLCWYWFWGFCCVKKYIQCFHVVLLFVSELVWYWGRYTDYFIEMYSKILWLGMLIDWLTTCLVILQQKSTEIFNEIPVAQLKAVRYDDLCVSRVLDYNKYWTMKFFNTENVQCWNKILLLAIFMQQHGNWATLRH